MKVSHVDGADVEVVESSGLTGRPVRDQCGLRPLHNASSFGHESTVSLLLDVRAAEGTIDVVGRVSPCGVAMSQCTHPEGLSRKRW